MPNVPNLPGVPSLSSFARNEVTFLAADAIAILQSRLFPEQWGIFENGAPVIPADNVVSLDFKQESTISQYPVEQGAFESYDKVASPFEARLQFSRGGSVIDRQQILNTIDAISKTLTLFDVVTPERIYTSVNITHYDYHRSANRGAGMIVLDVLCTEVRVNATPSFSSTQSPSGASPVSGGNVQTFPVPSAAIRRAQ